MDLEIESVYRTYIKKPTSFLWIGDWSVRKIGLKELWTLKWYRELNTAKH